MTLKKRRVLIIICFLAFIIASIIIDFYVNGYRLDSKFNLIKTGGIYVYSPRANSDIYINNQFKKQLGILQNGIFVQNLKPGKYTVLVAKDGYWPWQKKIEVKAEAVSDVRAMLVSQNPQGKIFLKGPFLNMYYDSEYKMLILIEKKNSTNLKKINFYLPERNLFLTPASSQISNLTFKQINGVKRQGDDIIISTDKGEFNAKINTDNQNYSLTILKNKSPAIAGEENKEDFSAFVSKEKNMINNPYSVKLSPGKNELIMLNNAKNIIWFDAARDTTTLPYFLFGIKNLNLPVKIFDSKFEIKNIDFFPSRRDVIIVAVNDAIYAIELDGRGGRIIQPIYKGKNPTFAILKGDKKIYVLDDGNLSYIELD